MSDELGSSGDAEIRSEHRGAFGRLGRWVKQSSVIDTAVTIGDTVAKLAIFYTIVTYLLDAPERTKLRQFQAWQVINTARMGDGGRSLALHDLNQDRVDLENIDLSGVTLNAVDLRGINLAGANLQKASLHKTDFSCRPRRFLLDVFRRDCDLYDMASNFSNVDLTDADLRNVNFFGSNFYKVKIGYKEGDNRRYAIFNCNFDHAQFVTSLARVVVLAPSYIQRSRRSCRSGVAQIKIFASPFRLWQNNHLVSQKSGVNVRKPPNSAVYAANPAGPVSEGQETPDAEDPARGAEACSSLARCGSTLTCESD